MLRHRKCNMGNTKSQGSNQAELKEISRWDLDQIKELPTKEAAKKVTSLYLRAVKNATLKTSLQDPVFLQSILFKESKAYEPLKYFLNLLRNSYPTNPPKYFTTPIGSLILVIIMYDISLPENAVEYFESSNISSTLLSLLNIVKNCNLPINSSPVNNVVVAQMLNSIIILGKGIKDKLTKFIADNSAEISSKFPILLQDMSPAEIASLISCIGSLDDYMIECIVDQFSFYVRGKLSRNNYLEPEPHILHSQILKIMSTADFDRWVECFSVCSLKSSKDKVKDALKTSPYTFMTKNIIYRLDKPNNY
jgi:hypothetical protein